MNPVGLHSFLAAVLREQLQRFTQLIETHRVGNGSATHAAQAAIRPTEQRDAPPQQLSLKCTWRTLEILPILRIG